MYTIYICVIDDNGKIVGKTKLYNVAHQNLAFALLTEWSNAIKKTIEGLIKQNPALRLTFALENPTK